MKTKKPKRIFRTFFTIISLMIALNITIVYIYATPSSAENETVVEIPDENISIDISGEVPEFTDAVECYLYAETALKTKTVSSTVTGFVKGYVPIVNTVLVHQTMDNTRTTDNNGIRYSTSISLKKGSAGANNWQKVAFDTTKENGLVYKLVTREDNNGEPDFSNSEWESYTQEEYSESAGDVPGNVIYTVRKSTIKKTEIFERTADGGYHIKFVLDNVKSTTGYKKLLKTSAGSAASGYPKFSYVAVEVWIDKEGNFTKYIMDDEASIPILGINCKMVSHYEETFVVMGGDVPQPFEIPFKIK